jgi:hypothetical protein
MSTMINGILTEKYEGQYVKRAEVLATFQPLPAPPKEQGQ